MMGLQKIVGYGARRRDVLRHCSTAGSGDRKSSVADIWKAVRRTSGDDKVERRRQTSTSDDWWNSSARYTQFKDEIIACE